MELFKITCDAKGAILAEWEFITTHYLLCIKYWNTDELSLTFPWHETMPTAHPDSLNQMHIGKLVSIHKVVPAFSI